MKFQFVYQFKRGDTCDYCGTVFGYPLCGLAIVDKELALSARAGLKLSAEALEKARNIADNYAAGKTCPKCERPTPEAYASACRRGAIFYAWAAPLLGGFLATSVFKEEPAFFYGCAAWAFLGAWFRIYLPWPFWIGKGTANVSEGVEIWGERPECARGEVLEAEERRWLLRKMAASIAAGFVVSAFWLTLGVGCELGDGNDAWFWIGATLLFSLGWFLALVASWEDDEEKLREIERRGERHFGCGWNYRKSFEAAARGVFRAEANLNEALAQLAELDDFCAAESARTVEILRSASKLTPEGAEALRIAETEVARFARQRETEPEMTDETGATRERFEFLFGAAAEKNGDEV